MPKKSKTPPALNVNVTAGASSAWAACIQHNTAALLTAAGITQAHLSVVLLEGRAMRALNKKSLGHDYVTDVITFDYSEGGAGKKPDSIDGEYLFARPKHAAMPVNWPNPWLKKCCVMWCMAFCIYRVMTTHHLPNV